MSEAQLTEKVAAYIRSIVLADASTGAAVWITTPEASFVHPRGHERGWDAIAANVYGQTMGATSSGRTLSRVCDLSIKVYGDVAVVEFDWDFVAVRRNSGETLHSTSRETQVYVQFPSQDWRLMHVHCSGRPVTAGSQGF